MLSPTIASTIPVISHQKDGPDAINNNGKSTKPAGTLIRCAICRNSIREGFRIGFRIRL
jgi:hypothetical protein